MVEPVDTSNAGCGAAAMMEDSMERADNGKVSYDPPTVALSRQISA
jgi:hypothetical protein